ncbi:MAG: energy transducer TonB [Bacteroidales bacterium]|nr:energy transducer TonB [Bacteroidales bacterium]
MKWKSLSLAVFVFFLNGIAIAQEADTPAASRKANLKKQLDYRYKGGFYSFEKKFNKTVSYPELARMNCIMGIVVVSLVVDCEGIPKEIKMKTSLGYGTNDELTRFFRSTRGEWNKCVDEKYSRFEIPIQFIVKGTQTNMEDALFICEGEMPGHACNDDNYYLKKAKKALEKGHGKKALKYTNLLIQRDPYNITYTEMKTRAIEMLN